MRREVRFGIWVLVLTVWAGAAVAIAADRAEGRRSLRLEDVRARAEPLCAMQSECLDLAYQGAHSSGDETVLTFRLANRCEPPIRRVAIGSAGWTLRSPLDGDTYTGELSTGRVEWRVEDGPLGRRTIAFWPSPEGWPSAREERFPVRLAGLDPGEPVTVEVDAGPGSHTFHLLLEAPGCAVWPQPETIGQPPSPGPTPSAGAARPTASPPRPSPSLDPSPHPTPTAMATATRAPERQVTQPAATRPPATRRPVPPTVAPPTVAPPTVAPPTVAPPTVAPPTVAPPAAPTAEPPSQPPAEPPAPATPMPPPP